MMNSKLLVFGGSGLVGSKFLNMYGQFFETKAPTATEVDILNKDQVSKIIETSKPDTVINFAAFTQVEAAEAEKGNKDGICYRINALGAKTVADACKESDKKLIHISTEYVFDGTKENAPYTEEDKPNPINWYGATKLAGEEFVQSSGCLAIVARISMPFSGFYPEKKDVARFFLGNLKAGKEVKAIEDQMVTPTYVGDIADGLKTLIDSESNGIYHISSTDSVTPLEFAKTIAELFKLDYSLISGVKLDEYNKSKKAKLLKYSWLNPEKFEEEFGQGILHTVDEGLGLFKKEVSPD